MRITLLTAIALTTLSASASAAPTPIPDDPNDAVAVTINIADESGATVKTLACDWTGYPDADDSLCLHFQSDPQDAFAAFESAGGVRADQHTVTEGADMAIAYSRRGDGTWLIRSRGVVDGREMHLGRVCTADGQRCVRWDARGARFAASDVRAAASKLRGR